MKWDICNFFQSHKPYIPDDQADIYQWGCDELKRLLTVACTMAQNAGNTDLVTGFANLCIKPEALPEKGGEG